MPSEVWNMFKCEYDNSLGNNDENDLFTCKRCGKLFSIHVRGRNLNEDALSILRDHILFSHIHKIM